jgi:hypothetical protein
MIYSCVQKLSSVLLAGMLFISVFHTETLKAQVPSRLSFRAYENLMSADFRRWEFDLTQRCKNCELKIIILDTQLKTDNVVRFVQTLENKKSELIELYGDFDSDYYNRLALMALGILGNETNFFMSKKYQIKNTFPLIVTSAKYIKSLYDGKKMSENSSGPTQIKIIPLKISEKYNVTKENLAEPEAAALATMGYLIEAFQELNNRLRLNQIPVDFIDDFEYYLPYIYFGKTRSLVKNTATPTANIYVKNMRLNMKKFELYQKWP